MMSFFLLMRDVPCFAELLPDQINRAAAKDSSVQVGVQQRIRMQDMTRVA